MTFRSRVLLNMEKLGSRRKREALQRLRSCRLRRANACYLSAASAYRAEIRPRCACACLDKRCSSPRNGTRFSPSVRLRSSRARTSNSQTHTTGLRTRRTPWGRPSKRRCKHHRRLTPSLKTRPPGWSRVPPSPKPACDLGPHAPRPALAFSPPQSHQQSALKAVRDMGILETSLRSLHYSRQLRTGQALAKFEPFLKCVFPLARRPFPRRGVVPRAQSLLRGGKPSVLGADVWPLLSGFCPFFCTQGMDAADSLCRGGGDGLHAGPPGGLGGRAAGERCRRAAAGIHEVISLRDRPRPSDAMSVPSPPPRVRCSQERAQVLLATGKLPEAAALHAGPLLAVVARVEGIPMRCGEGSFVALISSLS